MIPKKAGTDVDLNAQIDKDLQQAQEAQKDKIIKYFQGIFNVFVRHICILI